MNPALAKIGDRARRLGRPVRLMEVCGTHTMVAMRSGLRSLLPDNVTLLSGPGCPVCVTPPGFIDAAIAIGREPGTTITTFGDLVRVPGSSSSLERERAEGLQVRVVYSAGDALALAEAQPDENIVFLGVGFETTAPTVALAVKNAHDRAVGNFSVLSAHKVMPPAMDSLIEGGVVHVDGFLCPGHVSVVTGARAFSPFAARHSLPCVITGFEPEDMLEGIDMLLAQLEDQRREVEIQYRRAVTWEGNQAAQRIMNEVFAEADAEWRGLGTIAGSGLALRGEFAMFDAAKRAGVVVGPGSRPPGCRCGDVLRGALAPPDCGLFGRMCSPEHPVGPCMVSSEGACAAYARYGAWRSR